MKTVDELMRLADAYRLTTVGGKEARAALLSALQEVVQPKCVCGENTLGVVHRADGPCYWPTEPHVAVAAIQPAQPYNADPSCTTVELAEMILSDCGCSSNNTSLVSRVANRIDAHMQSAQPVAQPSQFGSEELQALILANLTQPVAQPLTDEQINKMWDELKRPLGTGWLPIEGFARAVELAHGIGGKE